MDALNIQLDEDFSCDLTESDLNDMKDIIQIGKVAWSPKNKEVVMHPDVPVFRIYTPYDPNTATTITFNVSKADYFSLQPSFYRCCASTGNRKIFDIFEKLVNRAISHYNRPFSMVACILSDSDIKPHVHFVDPAKNVVLTTYYWTLTNDPVDGDFVFLGERSPLYRQGYLEFNPAMLHGAECRDNNMRFYVLIDSM